MKVNWQPGCDIAALKVRAAMLKEVRQFFEVRNVLEVETPLLSRAAGTDPHIASFKTLFDHPQSEGRLALYLNSSPEFSMKRLLAAGSGSIFQICKAFRNGEAGRYHNPEFSILEWYRIGFDLKQLIEEVEQLITTLVPDALKQPTIKQSYSEVFQQATGVAPLTATVDDFINCARNHDCIEAVEICERDHSLWLDFLFSHLVQPSLGKERLCFIVGFPACQASLARLNETDARVSERVELFINGVELGNGFFELSDADEQMGRFTAEATERELKGLPEIPIDQCFLAALESGLPSCSGIAIGLDRLLMLILGEESIDRVLSFSVDRV
jgi:lysyl-tRNA synthetase class 2